MQRAVGVGVWRVLPAGLGAGSRALLSPHRSEKPAQVVISHIIKRGATVSPAQRYCLHS